MKILSTKQLDSVLIESARAEKIEVSWVAVIRTVAVDVATKSLQSLDFDALVFTSSSGVKFAFENKELWQLTASKPVYAISGKTRDGLIKRDIMCAGVADDAERLADVIIEAGDIKGVLHLCGNLYLDSIGRKLGNGKISYQTLVVYRTELLYPHTDVEYDALMFFSPSGVDSFFTKNEPKANAIYCCVGHTTAEHLRSQHSKLDIIVAERPEPQSMIDRIIEHKK